MVNWSNGRSRLKASMTQSRYFQIVRGGVDAVAVRVGVAGHVEPVPRPALAVVRRRQQPIHQPLVSVGPRVVQEGVHFRGVGGRPVRSRLTRRISVPRSASGEGLIPSCSRRARMKWSIALRGQTVRVTTGKGGRTAPRTPNGCNPAKRRRRRTPTNKSGPRIQPDGASNG